MKILYTIVLIVTISCLSNSQQNVIYNVNSNEAYVAKYNSGVDLRNKNIILEMIASSIPKSAIHTQFVISYVQSAKITKRLMKLDMIVNLSNFNFTGDIFYKSFPMQDVLLPSLINIKLNWKGQNNNILQSYNFDNVRLENDPSLVVNLSLTDTFNQANYSLEIIEKQLIFDQENVNRFRSKKLLIDDYFNYDTQMRIAFNELKLINLNNIDRVFEYKTITDRNATLINNISTKDFTNQLDLNSFDPADFQQKYSDLYQQNAQLSIEINNIIQNLHQIYYTKGLEFLSEGKIDLAGQYFNKSINSNIMFAPGHYQLAKIDFHNKNISQAILRIKDILFKMQPDPNTHNLTVDLAKNIYQRQIMDANAKSKVSRYDDAIEILRYAEDICTTISGVYCDNDLKQEFSTAYTGKLNEYIYKIEKLISARAFRDAESMIGTAKILISNNSSYLNISQLNQTYINLYNAYVIDGNEQLKNNKYEKALDSYENAKSICYNYSFVDCTDNLNQGIYSAKNGIYTSKLNNAEQALKNNNINEAEKLLNDAINYQQYNNLEVSLLANKITDDIKLAYYSNLIKDGLGLNNTKDYENALRMFSKAKDLENQYNFVKDSKLDSYIKNSSKALLMENVSKGNNEVEQNRVENAKRYYYAAQEIQSKYSLDENIEVNNALTELRDKIFSQECKNAQAEFDKLYNKAIDEIKNQKFIDADQTFLNALNTAQNMADCRINTTKVDNKKKEILGGVMYQKKLLKIDKLITLGKYQEVIDEYLEIEMYYNGNSIGDLGISHVLFYDFIKSNKDSRLINFTAGYYSQKAEFDKTLQLLDEIRTRNYQAGITKDNQIYLGTHLAIRDHKQNPQIIPKNNVLNYTKGNSWYKYMKKAYIKQWKNL